VITAGARVNALLSAHTDAPLVTPRRVPVCWFTPPSAAAFSYGTYPVNFWQIPDDELGSSASAGSVGRADPATPSEPWEVYSLPVTDGVPGVKVAAHNRLRPCDPDSDPQMVSPEEIDLLRGFVERYIPELRGADVETERCFYATTSDGEFRLGSVPGTSAVFAGAFAGHGFKFAPVLGEILADLATGRTPGFDLSLFTWGE
jgi:glycine/D-amino acid oxidase-like deaminating enzyme